MMQLSKQSQQLKASQVISRIYCDGSHQEQANAPQRDLQAAILSQHSAATITRTKKHQHQRSSYPVQSLEDQKTLSPHQNIHMEAH